VTAVPNAVAFGRVPSVSICSYNRNRAIIKYLIAFKLLTLYLLGLYACAPVVKPIPEGPKIPANAITVSDIHALPNWVADHDEGTLGSSTGLMSTVPSPSRSGKALKFDTTYQGYGGERYYVNFGDDTSSKNFVYDGWIYLTDSSDSIATLELDMNQVMPNGETVIFGIQCDGWSGTWDYTENAGTPNKYVDHWVNSKAACNIKTWTKNTWHHIQFSYSRDDLGNVNYQSVWLDGNEQQINVIVPSSFAIGWVPSLITNFQVDGLNQGAFSSTFYLDNLSVSRW